MEFCRRLVLESVQKHYEVLLIGEIRLKSERITIPGTPIVHSYARLHVQYGLTKDVVVNAVRRLDDISFMRIPGDSYYAVSFFSDWGGRLVAAFIVYVDKHVVVPIRDGEGLVVYTAHHRGIHAVTRWALGAKLGDILHIWLASGVGCYVFMKRPK